MRPNVSPTWEGEPRQKVDLGPFVEKAHELCRTTKTSDPDRHSDALIDLIDVEDDDTAAQEAWMTKWFPNS
jgi:hypothetical protein